MYDYILYIYDKYIYIYMYIYIICLYIYILYICIYIYIFFKCRKDLHLNIYIMLYFTEYQIIKYFSGMLCQNIVPQTKQNKIMKLG